MSAKRNVLIVDDERAICQALSRLLTGNGYAAHTAANGEEGLALMQDHAIQLVISDKEMPGMTGIQFLEQVRLRYPHVCRVLLTGRPDFGSAIKAINESEVYRYVEKPWDDERLLSTLYFAFQAIDLASELQKERERSEKLLLDVLPWEIAERLKAGETPIADRIPQATVLFADLVDFTRLSAHMSPPDIVSLLNSTFTAFDQIASRHGAEKIKTLGDGYLAAAGLPGPHPDHVAAMVEMGLDMSPALSRVNEKHGVHLELRIGIHTGPVIAGVIGARKLTYDLWGDTVNIASRMESLSVPGRIHVTQAVHEALRDRYAFESRGALEVKGKGELGTYFLIGRQEGSSRP